MIHATPSFADFSRHKGKRERTRASLLDATARLMAEYGPEDLSISLITEAAGVANGTFYNHFTSKSEIVAETAFGIIQQIAAQIHRGGAAADPIKQMATGCRLFVRFAVAHPTWAWALLRSVDYLPDLRPKVYRYISATLHRGVEAGLFKVQEDDFTLEILVSMMFAAVRAELTGAVGGEGALRVAEMQLRLLGVAEVEASAVAYEEAEEVVLHMPGPSAPDRRRLRRRVNPDRAEPPIKPE